MIVKDVDSDGAPTWIVSVHDVTPYGYLAFDVAEMLDALGPSVDDYIWEVTNLDCTGGEMASLCGAVEDAKGRGGVRLSTFELRQAARDFGQTVDGTFIAIPRGQYSDEDLRAMLDLARFPETQAQVVVQAVDSTMFEVLTKDYDHVRLLKEKFIDVRDEEPVRYFGHQA